MPSVILIHAAVWPQYTCPKIMEALPPLFREGELGPHNTVTWAEAYLHIKWHLNPSNHLATTDMGRKLGAVPLWGRMSWVLI